MPTPRSAFAAALPALLLAACSAPPPAAAENGADNGEAAAAGNAAVPEPVPPGTAVDPADPVPPPDAVSHPNGYLPPAPGEAEPANSSGPETSPPATEDEYMRNKQSGRP